MESNTCDINHLDADVLLPPRKRLLAGLKRQNSDVNSPNPSVSSGGGSEFDSRLNNFLKSHLSNPNLSNEEIVEASRLAAVEAAKVAQTARAAAEEKAAKAAKAVAAAKSALELVATVTEETSNRDKYLKKNKMKKHVQVQTLYDKQKGPYNCKTDEELARKLHQAINSSPRISKNTSTSESKNHKQKKLKGLSSSEKIVICNGGAAFEGHRTPTSNGNGMTGDVDCDGSLQEGFMARVDLNIPKFNKNDGLKMDNVYESKFNRTDQLNMENCEAESVLLEERVEEDGDHGIGKKRVRIKQKKLPLSVCNIRDQGNFKDELKSKSLSSTEEKKKATASSKSLFSVGPSGDGVMPVERPPMWKCQAFKAPSCVKQNKVMQS